MATLAVNIHAVATAALSPPNQTRAASPASARGKRFAGTTTTCTWALSWKNLRYFSNVDCCSPSDNCTISVQVWANNTKHDSVIFTDNDYEVFISPDGSNHFYKEFEMNARGVWWDLCLNKPYTNGGYENSSRVFNQSGWDDPGLRTGQTHCQRGLSELRITESFVSAAAKVLGCSINDPSSGPCRGWSVEIAFPLAAISLNNTSPVPPKPGQYWRINFSRVEWKVPGCCCDLLSQGR